ncbi:hypothetical protein HDU97_005733 [Phlyctochytrium planicorne]|nr:hypothetical protein HDU97_005733 [Phlyctochytrium planicorne]
MPSLSSSMPSPLLNELRSLKPLRILILHGNHQTSEIFRTRIEKLEFALVSTLHPSPQCVYLDAPFEYPLKDGDSVRLRGWFPISDDDEKSRSYCGCKALKEIETLWKQIGPFDGIIGFSGGGAAASMIASMPERFPGLSWLVLAGTPRVELCDHLGGVLMVPERIRSLHIVGDGDTLVLSDESLAFAEATFGREGLERHQHPHGHSMPIRSTDVAAYLDFIVRASRSSGGDRETMSEELESLTAIYGEDLISLDGKGDGDSRRMHVGASVGAIKVPTEDTRWEGRKVHLLFRLGPSYPSTPAYVKIFDDMNPLQFPSSHSSHLINSIRDAVKPLTGSPSIFEAVCTAQQTLQDLSAKDALPPASESDSDSDSDSESEAATVPTSLIMTSSAITPNSKSSRGPWRHTIGLVGKPSAGKSTFFNSATQSTQARVAPHPFTTIDPNVGVGWWAVPPSMIPKGWKESVLMPCLVKDVAGLVPGACEGRGRGNQFLNDLCDADVLIHVVDASGLSDEDGNVVDAGSIQGEGGMEKEVTTMDPMHDIRWAKEELRQWILGNIKRKWDSVLRKPAKLIDMFSGYQAPKWLIDQAIRKGGLDVTVDKFYAKQHWTLAAAERVVDAFLAVRFPILLALNKADLPTSAAHIQRIMKTLGESDVSTTMKESGMAAAVPVCAAAETWLQAETLAGRIQYTNGGTSLTVSPGIDTAALGPQWNREFERAKNILESRSGTGILQALTAAIMLRPPVVASPVSDLDGMTPLPLPTSSSHLCVSFGPGGSYIALKPGTTISDLFSTLSHGIDAPLAGQYVRAEGMARDKSGRKMLKKETEVDASCAVVKLMSNRKSRWQNNHRGNAGEE